MRNVYLDFTHQIVAHARSNGRDISGDAIVALNQILNVLFDLNPASMTLGFALGAGRYGTLTDVLHLLHPQQQRMAA